MPPTRPAFYRSPVVRWVFMLTGTLVAVSLSPWAPPGWHDSPSLLWLHRLFPWPAMSAAFAVYVLLLAANRMRLTILADLLGLGLYAVDLLAITATAHDNPVNGLGIAAFTLACLLHWGAARLAYLDLEGRRHKDTA